MRKLAYGLLTALVLTMSVSMFAQQPPPPQKPPPPMPVQPPPPVAVAIPCPQFQVQGPNRPMRDGEQVNFAANVGGGDPKVQPIYSWSISTGTIISGQGTRSIVVDSTGAGNEREIIADLLVGGYSYECTNRAASTAKIAAPANKVDEFGDLPEKDEAGKLDSIIKFLAQSPDRVFLVGYAGRTNVRGYASDVLRRMRAYMAKSGVANDRVVVVDGGFRETPAYEIWVVPIGAENPRSTPTIDRKDIVYPKPPPQTPVKKP